MFGCRRSRAPFSFHSPFAPVVWIDPGKNLKRGKAKVPVKKKSTTKKAVTKKAAKKATQKRASGAFTPQSAAHLAKMLKDFHRRLVNLETLVGTDTPPPTGSIDFP